MAAVDIDASAIGPGIEAPPQLALVAPSTIAIDVDWEALTATYPPRRYLAVRQVVDRAVATLMLLALLPAILVIAVIVRMDSEGPVFFKQSRAGRHLKPFKIFKFRTMSVTAPHYSHKVDDSDARITRAGRFLRKSGLDEIPQLINVVRGEMALIGPRPEQVALLRNYRDWQHGRHLVRPGITGWWQIHHRSAVPMYMNVEKDIYYVQHAGPVLDLKVILGTFNVLLSPLAALRRRHDATPVSSPHPTVESIAADVSAGRR